MPNFVYTMTLASGNSKLVGTPVDGFAPLELDSAATHYKAQSALDVQNNVQNIVLQASGTPGLTLAVPSAEVYKYFIPCFIPKTQYDSLTIFWGNQGPDRSNAQ